MRSASTASVKMKRRGDNKREGNKRESETGVTMLSISSATHFPHKLSALVVLDVAVFGVPWCPGGVV